MIQSIREGEWDKAEASSFMKDKEFRDVILTCQTAMKWPYQGCVRHSPSSLISGTLISGTSNELFLSLPMVILSIFILYSLAFIITLTFLSL